MRRATFVVVEGLDGVGKSTIATELARRLGAVLMATPPPMVAEPRRLLELAYDEYPLARMLWYASTGAAVSQDVARLVATGQPVVLARYFLSTLVYAAVRGATCTLEEVGRHLLAPDMTVYLYARPEVRAARMGRRGENSAEDARTLEPAWDRALDAGYRAFASHPAAGRFLPVDVSEIDPGAATEYILSALTDLDERDQ